MRIATLILSLFLVVPMTIQSCVLYILPGQLSGPGAIGVLTAMLTVVALAFVLPHPYIASVLYLFAAIFAFLGSTAGFGDMGFYSLVLLILAGMAFIGGRRDKGVKQTISAHGPARHAGPGPVSTSLVVPRLEWSGSGGANLSDFSKKELYDLLNRPGPLQLAGINLSGTELVQARLIGANLADANLLGVNLAGANLAGANLAGANLAGANLERANLAEANLEEAGLAGAHLVGADLAGAYLAGANLVGANLSWANLAEANLENANLEQANLRKARLTKARLEGANFKGTDLTFADLRKTDRSKVVFDDTTIWPEFYYPPRKR